MCPGRRLTSDSGDTRPCVRLVLYPAKIHAYHFYWEDSEQVKQPEVKKGKKEEAAGYDRIDGGKTRLPGDSTPDYRDTAGRLPGDYRGTTGRLPGDYR